MELAYGHAEVDKVVACTRIDVVGIEPVPAHGYTPTNSHFHEHRDTWEKMIVADAVDIVIHKWVLVQSHVR